MTKICNKCKKRKNVDDFHKFVSRTGVYNTCKSCSGAINPNSKRASNLKRRNGMTETQYNEIFEIQKGCCAICNRHQSEFTKALSADHNHEFRFFRGLLCFNCNTMLGQVKEDIEVLQAMIDYLHEWEI